MSDYDNIESLQEQGIIDSKRVATIKICLVIFFHSCIFAVLASGIFAIWLDREVGLDSLQIGELLGMKTLVAVFYKPAFGWFLDKTQLRIRFIITIAIAGLGAGPFFQFVYKPLLMTHNPTLFYTAGLLGGVYFGYVIIAGGAAVYSYCGRYIQAHGALLSKISASSFCAWLMMGPVLTMLYTINPTWGFYLASFAAVCMICMLLSLKIKAFDTLNTKTTSKKKIKIADLKLLIMNPRFYVLAFFAITIMVVIYAQEGQVRRYSLTFWPADMKKFGLRLGSFMGIPFNIIILLILRRSSSFIKKINSSKSMILLAICYGIGLLVFGLASLLKDNSIGGHYVHGVIAISIACNIMALVNPFGNLVVLSYITASFNKRLTGVVFLVGFNFICNLFGTFGHTIVGGMFKVEGWGKTYFQLSIYIFICTIILYFLMQYSNSRDKKRVMTHLDKEGEDQGEEEVVVQKA